MRIEKIEWKNIFAYGEEVQRLEYTDGQLVLLKGRSGSGKSSILSLPSLLLYGKLDKLKNSKSSIANRTNKNGWIQGTIKKGSSTYVIERTFSPNSVTVWKDGVNIDNYGSKDAQEYIDNEIVDLPLATFNNMISISMKRFKSFLTMSPNDRKQIIDRVFSLEVINLAFEQIKKDAKEVGNAINSDNATLFQLQQTMNRAVEEMNNLKEKIDTEENKAKIAENNELIDKCKNKLKALNEKYQNETSRQQEISSSVFELRRKLYENGTQITAINEKMDLFAQDKCPTCGSSFSAESFDMLRSKLKELKQAKEKISNDLNASITECNASNNSIQESLNKIQEAATILNNKVSELNLSNAMIENQLKSSGEYKSIQNIINTTTDQINNIKTSLSENTQKLHDFQSLALVFSIDGVKQKVINNYIPILNKEICENLELVNFPYQIDIDNKFEPHLKELGVEVQPETLSDGEETRVDLIILCSLFKLLKRRYPSMNILFIDEVISSLSEEDSGSVLDFLKSFASTNNLCIFVVSHTSLYLDNFDTIIEVEKNGFSKIKVTVPCA